MKLTKDTPVFPPSYCGGDHDIMIKELYPHIVEQILSDQEKALEYEGEKELNNGLQSACEQLEQENKQLKEELGNVLADKHCLTDCLVSTEHERDQLKEQNQTLDKMLTDVSDDAIRLEKIVDRLKAVREGAEQFDAYHLWDVLDTILKGEEKHD